MENHLDFNVKTQPAIIIQILNEFATARGLSLINPRMDTELIFPSGKIIGQFVAIGYGEPAQNTIGFLILTPVNSENTRVQIHLIPVRGAPVSEFPKFLIERIGGNHDSVGEPPQPPIRYSPMEDWIDYYHKMKEKGYKVSFPILHEQSGYAVGTLKNAHEGCEHPLCQSRKRQRK